MLLRVLSLGCARATSHKCCMDPGQSAALDASSSTSGAPRSSSPLPASYEGEPDWPAWFGGHKHLPGRASAGYAQQSDPKQVRHFYQETSCIFAGDEFENAEAHAENNAAASGELLRLFRSSSRASQALVDQIVGPCLQLHQEQSASAAKVMSQVQA